MPSVSIRTPTAVKPGDRMNARSAAARFIEAILYQDRSLPRTESRNNFQKIFARATSQGLQRRNPRESDPTKHYVGITGDVDARLAWHNSGPCGYTVAHRPWAILVVIEFRTEPEAVRFEKYSS